MCASSRNLCSSAVHDPSTCTGRSCEQVLASAPCTGEGENHSQPKGTSQKPWGALACVVWVLRTELS